MKNNYFKTIKIYSHFLIVLIVILIGNAFNADAQVRTGFTQRTSTYTPTKKIYNVQGDFAMMGNTNLTLQNYSPTTNNNGQNMQYVDVDNDPNTFNSSSATLALSTENGASPDCSKIIYAGLYWTGAASPTNTFTVSKQIPNGTATVTNQAFNVGDANNIPNTNYSLAITRNSVSTGNGKNQVTTYNPVYTFSYGTNTYVFNYSNTTGASTITLSINGATATNIPVTIATSGTTATATLTSPYTFVDGAVSITINQLIRSTSTNLSTTNTQTSSFANGTISGTINVFTTITKTLDKRKISLKGPNASSYTQFTAASTDIYYPASGVDDNIFSAYVEVTDYVKTNGIGAYFAADIALVEGNVGTTGSSGGWGMIVIYENSKMKYRDVTIFDGYAYVNATNTSGISLPVSGFNSVQTGNVGIKLGVMASEGDVSYTGDYFQIQQLNTTNYLSLTHSNDTTTATNFFDSSIDTGGGARNPNLVNNTGIDINMFSVPNVGNTVIGNNQTATNFKYGTTSDTYSIFAIAMAVDAYIPVVNAVISPMTLNGNPVSSGSITALPGDILNVKVDVTNQGTEAVNNTKFVIAIPYTADYVNGSLAKTINFLPLPTPNNYYFDPTLGPKGSIVFDFGTLPLPVNPSTILANFSFSIKITTDCSILKNPLCNQNTSVSGLISGTGATTGVNFSNKPLYIGYTSIGNCVGEPILNPLIVNINSTNYITANCPNTDTLREFVFCTTDTTIPVTSISDGFPAGSLFYNEYPVTNTSIQYTITNPFPATSGSVNYFCVPPGASSGCYFPFKITVTNVGTIPTTTTAISYCQGSIATPLAATATNPAYTLYYFTSLTGTPQLSLIPSTAISGQTTYYVAEAASGSCIGPKKAIVVTVNAKPAEPAKVNCWDTFTFNTTTCTWINNHSAKPVEPAKVNCWDTFTFNTTTCTWINNNTPKPAAPTVLCYQTATWNGTTCQYDITGEQPAAPTVLCYQTATWNATTCQYDVTGTQPIAPTVLCYQTATWNPTTCIYDVTGEQPAAPTILCYQTATWNPTSCIYDVTGTQPTGILTSQTNISCFGGNTGSVVITPVGGSAPYIITPNQTGLNAGLHIFTITDNKGCNATVEVIITDGDGTPPVINNLPSVTTISCPAVPVFAQAIATDNIDATVSLTFVDVKTSGACTGSYSITRTWTATDACGNTSTASQTINVQDITGPTTTTPFSASIDVKCDAIPAKPDLVFVDDCSAVGTAVYTENIINKTTTSYSIIRQWDVADTCGNPSKFIQVVNVTINNSGTSVSSTANNTDSSTIDLNSLLPAGTPTNGTWKDVDDTGALQGSIFTPLGVSIGNHVFEYTINDGSCPLIIQINMSVEEGKVLACGVVKIHNAFSPNGDNKNAVFVIDNIEDISCYPDNSVEIYNRWGVLVYQTKNYNNGTNVFDGTSQGRSTIEQSSGLPTGTYYYIVNYTSFDNNGKIQTNKKDGYLYLTR
ncbi:gliding motility-associated C-terminal domain-containing protein [Flavobacterium sp.]|uniref:T9SS type B sorting domain-containing protein n=1 Tax=Flavobacterium sp. TaxID=239 RepID=UPI003797D2E2